MQVYQLNSSVIESVIDNTDAKHGIDVRFKNGRMYSIPNATKNLLRDFLSAKSAGVFFNAIIRPNYEVVTITPEWTTIGIAVEDIKVGDRLELNPQTGSVRKLQLPPLE